MPILIPYLRYDKILDYYHINCRLVKSGLTKRRRDTEWPVGACSRWQDDGP